MKKAQVVIICFIVAIASGLVGFIIGQNEGRQSAQITADFEKRFKSIDELKSEILIKEKEAIITAIDGKAGIETVDEGGLFTTNYKQYFSGTLSNLSFNAIQMLINQVILSRSLTLIVPFTQCNGLIQGNLRLASVHDDAQVDGKLSVGPWLIDIQIELRAYVVNHLSAMFR